MTTRQEEELIVSFFESKNGIRILYFTVALRLPVSFDEVCLLEISRLREAYRRRVKAIGFSGHHLGIAVDPAAVALGAEWIERHYTLDRTWKGRIMPHRSSPTACAGLPAIAVLSQGLLHLKRKKFWISRNSEK
jgi:sialic acid synthase SpsE